MQIGPGARRRGRSFDKLLVYFLILTDFEVWVTLV